MNLKNLGKTITTQFLYSDKTRSILYNRYLLWAIFILSIFNLYYKMAVGNLMFLVRFLLIGFVVSFFSRNMSVILFLALSLANLLEHGMKSVSEGMQDATEDEEEPVSTKEAKEPMETEEPEEPSKKSLHEEKKKNDVAQEGIQDLTDSAEELLKIQKEVLKNFDVIEPKMKRAETLIGKMNKVAEQMQNIRQ